MTTAMHKIENYFIQYTDISALAIFRILFSVYLLFVSFDRVIPMADNYWTPDIIGYTLAGIFIVSVLFLLVGLFTRCAALVALLAHVSTFFIEILSFSNHYYLECLLLFLLVFAPAGRRWSIDNLRKKFTQSQETAMLRLFQLQLIVVFGVSIVQKAVHGTYFNSALYKYKLLLDPDFQWFRWLTAEYGGFYLDFIDAFRSIRVSGIGEAAFPNFPILVWSAFAVTMFILIVEVLLVVLYFTKYKTTVAILMIVFGLTAIFLAQEVHFGLLVIVSSSLFFKGESWDGFVWKITSR